MATISSLRFVTLLLVRRGLDVSDAAVLASVVEIGFTAGMVTYSLLEKPLRKAHLSRYYFLFGISVIVPLAASIAAFHERISNGLFVALASAMGFFIAPVYYVPVGMFASLWGGVNRGPMVTGVLGLSAAGAWAGWDVILGYLFANDGGISAAFSVVASAAALSTLFFTAFFYQFTVFQKSLHK